MVCVKHTPGNPRQVRSSFPSEVKVVLRAGLNTGPLNFWAHLSELLSHYKYIADVDRVCVNVTFTCTCVYVKGNVTHNVSTVISALQ